MKKSRITETQIVSILGEADAGRSVQDLCRNYGISPPTYNQWKSKYGGREASELRWMYAGANLERDELKKLLSKKRLREIQLGLVASGCV